MRHGAHTTLREGPCCRRRPYPTRRSPAHNLTTAPHAQLQVTSSCGPRGLCNPPSVTTMDETLCLCRNSIGCCISQSKRRLPRCTTASGSPLILNQRHEGICVCIQSWANSGHHAAPHGEAFGWPSELGGPEQKHIGPRARARTLAHALELPCTRPERVSGHKTERHFISRAAPG